MNEEFEPFDNLDEENANSEGDLQERPLFSHGIEVGAASESELLSSAAERLRSIDGLREEEWKNLDAAGREAVLREVGREISRVFSHPAPPLLTEHMDNNETRGYYGDGYSSNQETGQLEGADYGIRLNSEGLDSNDGYISEDPRTALETYLHEFRHSFQHEQALRFEKPQFRSLVEDGEQAESWSENFKAYNNPENNFDAYFNQAVETDARSFAEQLIDKVYK